MVPKFTSRARRGTWRWQVPTALLLLISTFAGFVLPSEATGLPTNQPGAVTLVNTTFTHATLPAGLVALNPWNGTAAVPCLSAAAGANACSSASGVVTSGSGDVAVLADQSGQQPNAGGYLVNQAFPSDDALYASIKTQSYGNGGGARTLWLMDANAPAPSSPWENTNMAYGAANGGIPGAFLGIGFDAAGLAARKNDPSCPAVGWTPAKSKSNEVVVRAGDTSNGHGTSGYCFVASSAQPFQSFTNTPAVVGRLHETGPGAGVQQFFITILPPAVTHDRARVTVSLDAADGRGMVQVLDVALPSWAWPTDGSEPNALKVGFTAANPTAAAKEDTQTLNDFGVVVVPPPATPPTEPQNVGVQWGTPVGGFANATVTWTTPTSNGGAAITSYTATLHNTTCHPSAVTGSSFHCTIAHVPVGQTYDVSVVASNRAGTSSAGVASSRLSGVAQTLTVPPLHDQVYGTNALNFAPTSDAGLTPDVATSGPCSYGNGQLTINGVGTCTVTVSQSGSADVDAATTVVEHFVVTPAPASVNVSDVSATYDGSAHAVNVTVNPSQAGVTTTYCRHGDATSCGSTPPTQPGVYDVTVKLNGANYAGPDRTATVTVAPKPVALPSALGLSSPPAQTLFASVATATSGTGALAVTTTGGSFSPNATVNVGVDGVESLGAFTVPSSVTGLANALTPASNVTVNASQELTVQKLSDLAGTGATVPYPNGGFPGPGTYFVLSVTATGFVPGSTVTGVLHSSPLVLASGVADANGAVNLLLALSSTEAGQSHSLYLAGQFSVTAVQATAAGTIDTTVVIPSSVLNLLAPQTPVALAATETGNAAHVAKVDVTLTPGWSSDASAAALNAAPLNPLAQPTQTMHKVTNLVAVAATLAATASVAASVGNSVRSLGGAARAKTPSSSSSSSSSGQGGDGPLSTESIEAVFDEVREKVERKGDQSWTYRFFGLRFLDRVSNALPTATAKYSPTLASGMADGAYLRAMFGSLSFLSPVVGLVLGVVAIIQTHGYPVPGAFGYFTAITVLSALDGWAGLSATAAVFVGAVVTGHLFSLHMLVAFFLLAAMWFGLPILVKGVRPLVRTQFEDFHDFWLRLGDVVLGPLFGGYLTSQLVGASSSAANLQLPIDAQAGKVGVFVGVAFFIRYLLETVASVAYPVRLHTVAATDIPDQHRHATRLATLVSFAFTGLLLEAFMGWTPVLFLIVGLQVLGKFIPPKIAPSHFPKWVYRMVPRGLASMLVLGAVGNLVSNYFQAHVKSSFWQVAGLLIAMTAISGFYAYLSEPEGEGFHISWFTRVAGIVIAVLTALQLTGHLI